MAPKHQPALVGYPLGEREAQLTQIKKSIATVAAIRALIRAGHPQYWYCAECGNSEQPYLFPWGGETSRHDIGIPSGRWRQILSSLWKKIFRDSSNP